ncbi:hypothetical protein G6742_000376 [Escherichia coli]|uniref:hypothetical protein n=1 Tax=Escherichia coli TaxID=562 RepID=UPI0010CB1BFF|nr:hypothetical protein [Escherichia coli]EFH6893679.1 hypothetical protein [Escherichia coli]EFJ1749971.1 hypothetical protein [Escherichia coli]HAV8932464.1 hypothetical protein [Escherichia coli]HAV9249489.1 hypothetical protein [Escherichia coli]HAW0312712.1 hypothetical protein [Escherichia coli]
MKKSEKQTRILQKAAYFYYYCIADTFIIYSALVSKISSIFPCSFSALRCGFFISDFGDLLKDSENFVGGLKNPGKPGHNFPGCVVSLLSLLRTFCPQEWRALFSVSSHESLPSR